MSDIKFTHLHVHSEYSLLDGSAKIKELVARAKELGMNSLAITDHGVMFGVIDFYKVAKEAGIKPILGCEVYVASGSRFNKENAKNNFYYHLVLLAENIEGYHNLIKLVSLGFTEGYYYKPRIDLEILKKYKSGLIALSACLSGPISKNILNTSYEKALEQALIYEKIMGKNNFFLELQDHGMSEQTEINQKLLRMSQETGIPIVCTNDTHYISEEDAEAHDILLCIQTSKTINDEDRMSYHGDQFYLKSPEQMYKLFPYAREGIENTCKISERCNVDIKFNEYKLPKFKLDSNTNAFAYLKNLCLSGLHDHYGNNADAYMERMDYELDVIKEMGFIDYFLIVWDFIRFAKESNIIVGPGRGSAAGSIVAYCLGITNIDPVKYNLIFERFLNPERISMPDIDIDFCYERRQEVIDYVIEKYGSSHVAQIITFGTLAARAAIRDVGRALAMPYNDVDRIAKMIPFELGITIKKALGLNPELNKAYEKEEDTKNLINMSLRLEGLPRHSSTHAAGVVICNEPVMEYVPLNQNDGVVTTQFSMNTLEELGLLKMDFLGLRTLTVIQNAVQEINRLHKISLDIDKIDFNDPKVFMLISQGKTEGVFQLESPGMKNFMKELQPSHFEDIIAGIALYRPGPMDFIPKYISGKKNADITYTHESLKSILESTYGCIVYQEQVMQIVRELAGYSLGRSDLVRRAMSKKKTSVMEKERKNFIYGSEEIPGCVKNGIPAEVANTIFDEMTDFAKYAFNKSHAAAYAVIGYQTAWLKLYYPVEYMAALMTSVMDFPVKVAEYIAECKKVNIKLLPPDINEGYGRFSCFNGGIRFGLLAIKNVGRYAIEAMLKERGANGPFSSLNEFINRMDGKELNKRCLESLIKAGAFDSLGGRRSQYMIVYKDILNGVNLTKKHNVDGQINLFDLDGMEDIALHKDSLPDIPEYGKREMLEYEKEVLGIYVSGHPLSEYQTFLKKHVTMISLDLLKIEKSSDDSNLYESNKVHDDMQVCVGGIIIDKSVKYTKNNKPMAFITIEDLFGTIEILLFPQIYERYLQRIQKDVIIVIKGRVSAKEDEDAKIICNEIFFNEPTLWLKTKILNNTNLNDITKILAGYSGDTAVKLYEESTKKTHTLDNRFKVLLDNSLIFKLKALLGEDAVLIK